MNEKIVKWHLQKPQLINAKFDICKVVYIWYSTVVIKGFVRKSQEG